ncbi:MAG: hypothetical protein M1812_008516 [Candelaria pacifica]|nr:MAG: hypothetical protein M1812_008516 [Candelaria pacifica]
MANATHDPELVNVKIVAHSPTSKTATGRLATIEVDDIELPFHFNGQTVEEAKSAAVTFYKENIFNKIFDLSPFKDVDGVNKIVLALFSKKTPKAKKETATKSEDKRHLNAGTNWYVAEGKTAVRVAPDQVQKYVDDGYLPGKKWAVALAKHEGTNVKHKKDDPNYVNPIAGKILIHKGTETLRVVEDELADRLKDGWKRGRVPKAENVAVEAPAEATSGKVEAEGDNVAETENASV